jgi:hypothetical protein
MDRHADLFGRLRPGPVLSHLCDPHMQGSCNTQPGHFVIDLRMAPAPVEIGIL